VTTCGCCGDCCRDIPLSTSKAAFRRKLSHGDARDDDVWAAWVAGWESQGDPETPDRESWVRLQADARFIIEHWHGGRRAPNGTTKGWTCDRFDPETWLCTAYEERPPICSDFPWYDRPAGHVDGGRWPLRCTFWADRPAEERPEGWVPVTFVHANSLRSG